MISLFNMFKVGIGPSSSHTIGPMKAGKQFINDLVKKGLLDSITHVAMDIYGSLSLTGKGHHTNIAIIMGLAGNKPATMDINSIPSFIHNIEEHKHLLLAQGQHEVDFPRNNRMHFHNSNLPLHENSMQIHTYNSNEVIYSKTYYSISSSFIINEEHFGQDAANKVSMPYPFKSATKLLTYCNETSYSLSGLAMQNKLALHSKKEINKYFTHVWQTMQACINHRMNTKGVLPGPLHMPHHASALHQMLVSSNKLSNNPMNVIDWVNMFALAVNKENTTSGHVVTAPTNSACSIIPAVLAYYDHFIESVSPDIYTHYFMAAGTIGALYKMNTSISSAEVGCQGKVGVACSMAAAGLAELLGSSPEQVCMAAEIGMEHNLGLTCNPVAGQVQVPCIEHNAIASVKAINTTQMALRHTSAPHISLDKVIKTMYKTSKDMNTKYHKTSHSGLAIKVQCD